MALLPNRLSLPILGLSQGMKTLSCGMWHPAPRPEIKLQPPGLGVRHLSHMGNTNEVLMCPCSAICSPVLCMC